MGLEVANTIAELEPANPLPSDPVNQGDDHLRLIKQVIRTTFPNGSGLDALGWNGSLTYPLDVLNTMELQFSADPDEGNLLIVPEASNITSKYMEIGEAGVISYREPLTPIGSVIQSVLTQQEMDLIYGVNVFVIADGSNVQSSVPTSSTQVDSRYFTLTGQTNIPNFKPEEGPTLLSRQATNDNRGLTDDGTLASSFGTQENSCEIGVIKAFGSDGDQDGFFVCDGRVLSIDEHPDLFDVIGTNFGSNDGGTITFNIPDLRGRFLRGRAAGQIDPDRNLRDAMNTGGATGDAVGSVQTDAFKAHTHTLSVAFPAGSSFGFTNNNDATQNQNGTRTTSNVGGSETRPNNAYVSYQIRYRSSFETVQTQVSGGTPKYVALNHFIRIN